MLVKLSWRRLREDLFRVALSGFADQDRARFRLPHPVHAEIGRYPTRADAAPRVRRKPVQHMYRYARTSIVLAGIFTVLFAGPVQAASAHDNDPVILNAVADLA